MGVLTGRLIVQLVEKGELVIKPFDRDMVQPATYDLRVGSKILASPLSSEKLGMVVELTEKEPHYKIHSGQMVSVLSYEKMEIPLNVCGRFGIRSTLARKGLNAFGGLQLDPGWRGRLNLSLLNVGPEPIVITLREPLFSVEFSRLEEPAEAYAGDYQDQDDFPAEQYNYILSARTTSLAEIPLLRQEMVRVSALIEELMEGMPDPDEGLELRPEVQERLMKSSALPRVYLVPAADINKKPN